MTKLEKAIKGLESCLQGTWEICEECPYHEFYPNGCQVARDQDALELLKRAGCILEEGLHYFPCGRKLLEDETYCEGDVRDERRL